MTVPLKLLWASPNTLLDTANGAALMVLECLKQLHQRGCEIKILGATVFVNRRGMAFIADKWPAISQHPGKFVVINRSGLEHRLLVTQRTERRLMLSSEEQTWFDDYCRMLDEDPPDMVLFFDRSLITLLTASEAKERGIAVGVFLMHGNNAGERWCRDVDLLLTDTKATASMYKEREGYQMVPLGTFVDPMPIRAEKQTRQNLLFINPIPQKGVVFVIQLADWLKSHRPDICLEIVDTRGTWQPLLEKVWGLMGKAPRTLDNVRVTRNTPDMASVYARARILLVPSLWWESGPRVIVEALSNGIPVIGSSSGGVPEVIGDGGIILDFPKKYFQSPFLQLFNEAEISAAAGAITELYDNDTLYQAAILRAKAAFENFHNLETNSDNLLDILQTFVATHAKNVTS